MPFRLSALLSVTDTQATRRLHWQVGLAFLFAMAVSFFVIDRVEANRLIERRAQTRTVVQSHLRSLGQSLDQALSATYAMAALVKQANGIPPDFEGTATQMLRLYPGVGAIQLAPAGVVRLSVPLAGNEKAIGHDLLKDPKRTREAFLARDTGKLTLAGPFSLIQGGLGAVGRLPVFIPDTARNEIFWGFTTVLIRFPAVLDAAGLGKLHESGYDYVIWRTHPDTGERQVIAATSGKRAMEQPISEQLTVPNGSWTLSAAPSEGWDDRLTGYFALAVGTLISLLFAAVAAFVLRQPIVLRDEVARRTKELQQSEERFESLFEQAPVALSVTNDVDDYIATRWNKAWLEAFGYAPELAQGKSGKQIGMWVSPDDRDRYIATARTTGEVRNMEVMLRHADGKQRLVAVSGRFIVSEPRQMLVTRYEDITDTRQAEQAIRELNATLENRVEARTEELKKTNAELWRAVTSLEKTQHDLVRAEKMAALGSLVAGVAHELNTPIGNSVTMTTAMVDQLNDFKREMASGLRKSTLENLIDYLSRGLDIVLRNLLRSGELITSFKQVSVDQASQIRRQFELDTVVGEILTTLQPSLKRTAITVDTELPSGLVLDSYPGPLGQVLVNLVNNAVLHAFDPDQPGRIRIQAEHMNAPEGDETTDSWIRLVVQDNGKGIPANVLPRIFDPFFTTRLGAGGSGLGLNISYNIVTALLGGRIRALSAPGEGTRMLIEMPANAPVSE